MREERMMILQMLEEEKVSSEEAARLLQALEEAELKEANSLGVTDFVGDSEEPSHGSNRANDKKTYENNIDSLKGLDKLEEKLGKVEVDLEKKGEALGEKMSKLGGDIATGATSVTDKVLKMVDDLLDKGSFDGMLFGSYKTFTETLEKDITNLSNPSLDFESVNGSIRVSPWDEDKVLVKATCHIKKSKYKDVNHVYEIIEEPNKIIFKPKYTSGIGIRLDISVPKRDYEKMNIQTSNGKIDIKDITSKKLLCDTSNSSIILEDIECKDIEATTKNGRISLSDVESTNIRVHTSNSSIILNDVTSSSFDGTTNNSKIIVKDLDSENVKLVTSNGTINLQDCEAAFILAKTSNASITADDIETNRLKLIDLTTSNAKINVEFSDSDGDFEVDAKTSMGHMEVNLPLVYEINSQKQLGGKRIKGHTQKESGTLTQVHVSTSNGSIYIN